MANPISWLYQVAWTYRYYYYSGAAPNREIKFLRDDVDETKIKVVVSACENNEWQIISELEGKDVNVEIMSTAEKVDALKKNLPWEKQDRKLSELSSKEQEKILNNLGSKWKIIIRNHYGDDPKFEKVTYIDLFKP